MRYRFGDFVFDTRSGQLTLCGQEQADSVRLAPQPAKLLTLLLEQRKQVVHRAAIQQHVWPDVEVAFEQSLHHCIRQIRNALGDSASEPCYIRTIHRRGYQFIADVEVVTDEEVQITQSTRKSKVLLWRFVGGLLGGGAVLLLGWMLLALFVNKPPVRIAVMTFQPPGQSNPGTPIAERLIAHLTNHPHMATEVIGPTTTAGFEQQSGGLRTLISAFNIDYILNGRFPADSMDTRFLAEVIRARDGAHVWVQYFGVQEADSLVAATIADAFVSFHREQH